MSEPLPHYVNIAKKLKSYGIDAYDEPMMFILGGHVVTAEIDAKRRFTPSHRRWSGSPPKRQTLTRSTRGT